VFSNSGEDADASVVLSHGFWQRRFGGDPHVIGRAVDVDGRPRTIIGIMPRDVEVPVPTDIWLPLSLTPAERAKRDALMLRVVGCLKPAVTIDAAQTEMSTIGRQLEASYPTTNTKRRPHVMALREFVQGTGEPPRRQLSCCISTATMESRKACPLLSNAALIATLPLAARSS
jgi:putative ABC transport system permease protein